MIQYGKQDISQADIEAVTAVLKSDFLTQGPKVEEFETKLAKYCGVTSALAVNSGTAALHLAYLAAGISEGDEVIVSPNTFVATTNMLMAVGATPVFCDIDLDTYNIDPEKIVSLITEKTKAIVTVDFSGQPCVYEQIRQIADERSLLLIADSSHALGADYDGIKVGAMADITTFSFHPVKSVTTAEGGALVTNNREMYEKAKLLRSHGVAKNERGENKMSELGYNYRMPDVLAALGSSQMDRLDEFIAKRREIAKWYAKNLSGLEEISLPVASNDSSWHLYVIRTKDKEARIGLRKHLADNKIGTNFHYPAVYKHPYYQEHGYQDVVCPNMETYHRTAVTLPCHTALTENDINVVCQEIIKFV